MTFGKKGKDGSKKEYICYAARKSRFGAPCRFAQGFICVRYALSHNLDHQSQPQGRHERYAPNVSVLGYKVRHYFDGDF